MDLMWFLFLAHLVGDYALQSDRMADEKRRSNRVLTVHVAIYSAVIAAALFGFSVFTGLYEFWTARTAALVAGLFVAHWGQDYAKSRFFPSRQAYYQDQTLHIVQLFLIRWLIM